MKEEKRPSVYLLNKCQAISTVLDFFLSGSEKYSATERRVVFMSQIDFWDWEMAELIFSFENFKERSIAWKTEKYDFLKLLHKNKILLQNTSVWHWPREEVVAPIAELNATIKKWNKLIDLCEKLMDKRAVENDPALLKNLDKFRKKELAA